mgnify:CR=1 FL=1
MQSAGSYNISEVTKLIRRIFVGTILIEGIGALILTNEFYKLGCSNHDALYKGIFHSISAFCNAGIDIIAENSLCNYATNPLINIVTSALIILGGLGYIVWWDALRVVKSRSPKNRKIFRHLTLHSKIAITVTAGLILVGALLIFVFEYSNPLTIGEMSLFDKIQVSFFQSVTTRTAGFATVPQENLTNASATVSIILMLFGGSPVGTAGGMKTVTIAVLICSATSSIGIVLHMSAIALDNLRFG